ncbi:MAG TPA: hypothetical protein VNT20_07865 [Flavisolibacter sp.]|jgi:hypothetical protein|nr:hypothetical protein [Flavisolibacter sp.]
MKKYLVRAYFKAGILVPFYTACFLSLMFCASNSFYDVLELTFYSGLTGLCSLTIFLNCYRKVIDNFIYSLLSWILLPLIFIAYVLATKVDWIVFKNPKMGDGALVSIYLVIFFLHVIGLFISFQSFRATVRLNRNDKEILNSDDEAHTMSNSDRNVQVSDTTGAK